MSITPPTSSSIAIILNTTAGAADKDAVGQRLMDIFRARGRDVQLCVVHRGEEIVKKARFALQGGFPIIVAGGGDGTVSAVASVLVGTDAALGVLPLGTLNHFAKDLRIPTDLEAAAQTILDGSVASVDVGEVNGRVFLNNSSLGLYPQIVRYRMIQQARLGIGKWPAFVWAAFMVFRRYPFLSLRLIVEGKEIRRSTPFVFIGNNEYEIERLDIGTRACLNAGLLSLYWTRRTGRLGLLGLAVRALLGRLREADDFEALCTSEAWIEARRPRLRVAKDGEVSMLNTPLHYRIRHKALRVIVPAERPRAD